MTIFSARRSEQPPGGDWVDHLDRVRVDEAPGALHDRDAEAIEELARLRRLDRSYLPFVLEEVIDTGLAAQATDRRRTARGP